MQRPTGFGATNQEINSPRVFGRGSGTNGTWYNFQKGWLAELLGRKAEMSLQESNSKRSNNFTWGKPRPSSILQKRNHFLLPELISLR